MSLVLKCLFFCQIKNPSMINSKSKITLFRIVTRAMRNYQYIIWYLEVVSSQHTDVTWKGSLHFYLTLSSVECLLPEDNVEVSRDLSVILHFSVVGYKILTYLYLPEFERLLGYVYLMWKLNLYLSNHNCNTGIGCHSDYLLVAKFGIEKASAKQKTCLLGSLCSYLIKIKQTHKLLTYVTKTLR